MNKKESRGPPEGTRGGLRLLLEFLKMIFLLPSMSFLGHKQFESLLIRSPCKIFFYIAGTEGYLSPPEFFFVL